MGSKPVNRSIFCQYLGHRPSLVVNTAGSNMYSGPGGQWLCCVGSKPVNRSIFCQYLGHRPSLVVNTAGSNMYSGPGGSGSVLGGASL